MRRDIPMYTKDTTSNTILHTIAPQKRVLEEQMKKLLLEAVMPIAETTVNLTKTCRTQAQVPQATSFTEIVH